MLGRAEASLAPCLVVIVLMVTSNVATNLVLPASWYLPWNLAMTAALLAVALGWSGRDRNELGLAPGAIGSGLRWGTAAASAMIGVLAVAAALPSTRDWFVDERAPASSVELLWQTAVRIPFGTVLMEEVAFRGVLPSVLATTTTPRRAVVGSIGAFGLWHILPAWGVDSVVGTVVVTTAFGAVCWWLRDRSGSLLAPIALHTATNSGAAVAAYLARVRT